MKRVQRALLTAAAVLMGMAAVAAPVAATPERQDQGRAELQRGLDSIVREGAVGAVVEVRDDRGVWRATSGVVEVGKSRPVPTAGRFRIGSITKTFVATVVLQLVDEGRLQLDDTVEQWLPGVVPDGENITLRHLLSHSSGLYDYLRTLPFPPSPEFLENRFRTWTAKELIDRALAYPPSFERPGSAFSYSNTNYALLGDLIEAATGHTYSEEVERRILRPSRLRDTTVPGTFPRIRGPHPHGYVPIEEDGERRLVDYTEMNPSVMGAGGEMISTTRDLNRFFGDLLAGRLLPTGLLEEMKKPGVAGSRYGLGLFRLDTTCGVAVYGNDGDALAFQTWSYATEDLRRQVTLALTPDFRLDLDDAVSSYLDEALC